ncbi:hypothetical protein KC19_4G048700 [Ceratodon purpureus]|uniref:Protein kinase domain-containing protein n=1 Tax=Ceratodon purpureus TaxID=3225 RepID=A0A8T0I6Q3_CERPU|nr:hypothetical protein KC19_4G048700 [Ceratodon purpureus]
MIRFLHLVLLIVAIVTASWPLGSMALNVLVGSTSIAMNVRQYLNASSFSLVLQPDCNLILYNRSQPVMSTNYSCRPGTLAENSTVRMAALKGWELDLFIDEFVSTTNSTDYTQIDTPLWQYSFLGNTPNPLYPYLILRANGSCDFYDYNNNHLLGKDVNGNPFLKPYPTSPNGSGESTAPNNLAFPFPPELAWKPSSSPGSSVDGFPYMPAGYFLIQSSEMRTVDRKFVLTLGVDCNLQCRDTTKNGSEGFLLWESGSKANGNPEVLSCELKLQEDGRLVIRNITSGINYWNSTVSGNESVSWVLRLSPNDGSLSISDIENPSSVLWSNSVGTNRANKTTTWIVVGVIVGVSVLAMAGLALSVYLCTRTNILDPAEKAFRRRLKENGGRSQTSYSQAKIKQATNNFEKKIGSGGFGDVFYGKLPDGQEIAAKVLSTKSHQSKKEFYNEIELLSVVHHKYLVSLLGYRCTRMQQILIYEYMHGGDLRYRLQGNSAAKNPLNWRQRTSITLQVAEGLEYLHDKCSPSIIHRDIKSTNILLTSALVAKVADFGLSKLRSIEQDDATHVTTVVKGTPGYLDPEYHETGMLTDKSDVYAFGIVLMEILTGQQHMYIAHRVAESWRMERLDDLPDPNLRGVYVKDEFVTLVELSLWCTRKTGGERPLMRQVVQRLRDMGLALLSGEVKLMMAMDVEFEPSEGSSPDGIPFSYSSGGMSSEIWRSEMQFHQSSRFQNDDQ